MKTIVLKVDYTDSTNKFWFDSYIKNKIVSFDPELKSIHEVIKDECEEEGMILTYGGKPQGNVYIDTKDGEARIVGYMYRGKTEIHDRDMPKSKIAYFDVWVSIGLVEEFEFEMIEPR